MTFKWWKKWVAFICHRLRIFLACVKWCNQLRELAENDSTILFQWICVLPAGYYWVLLDSWRFCTFIFLFCSLSNSPSQTCITYVGADWSLIKFWLSECCRMALTDGGKSWKGGHSAHVATTHAAGVGTLWLMGRRAGEKRGKKPCVPPLSHAL